MLTHFLPDKRRFWLAILYVSLLLGLGLVGVLVVALDSAPAAADVHAAQSYDLELSKEGPDATFAAEVITYTLRITNASGQLVNNVVITDTWFSSDPDRSPTDQPPPAEYDGNYQTDLPISDFTYVTGTSPYAQWTISSLAPGATGYIIFTMTVPPELQPALYPKDIGPTILGNSAVITTTSVPTLSGGYDAVETMVQGPVLDLRKQAQVPPDGLRPGRLITYILSLENYGPNRGRSDSIPATSVVITDRLPNDTTFVAAWPASISAYFPATRTVRWVLTEPLPVDSIVYVTFTARLSPTFDHKTQVRNPKEYCGAIADHMINRVRCRSDVNKSVDSLFEKEVATGSPPSAADETFPNRIITYSATIYNPLTSTVSNLRVTDTLPLDWTFDRMVYPISGMDPVTTAPGLVVWDGLTIPGSGFITFTFRVSVSAQTDTGTTGKTYRNELEASSPDIVFQADNELGRVEVVPQIILFKTVTPTEQLVGHDVTYTLIISNIGDTDIFISRITDTLPEETSPYYHCFIYQRMVPGSLITPSLVTDGGRIVVWENITTLAAGASYSFSFVAKVYGNAGKSYKNEISGYSPDTFIPTFRRASVKVGSPIEFDKEVTPETAVQGEVITYTVTYRNWDVMDYRADYFEDELPDGFYHLGSPLYSYTISPPFTLTANGGSTWMHSFTATIVGEGTGSDWCNDLPTTISQQKQKVWLYTSIPGIWWYNGQSKAPLNILPVAQIIQEITPQRVGRSRPLTITLVLSSNVDYPLTGLSVTDTLPAGFSFLDVLPGTPSPVVTTPVVAWQGITLPARGLVHLSFLAQAAPASGDYRYNEVVAFPTDSSLCIPRSRETLRVRDIEVSKSPDPRTVGPLGEIVYTIDLNNQTSVAITDLRITDTLPFGFRFLRMEEGDPAPISTNPLVWANIMVPPQSHTKLHFRVRAYVLFGEQLNLLEGWSTPADMALKSNYTDTATVLVVPGVALFKEVSPEEVDAGQTVVYTLTLANYSGQDMVQIRITDTLPVSFTYQGMVTGPEPVQTNPLVWTLNRLDHAEQQIFSFLAKVDELLPSGTYYNQASGEAWAADNPQEQVYIPDTDDTAPVRVHGLPTVWIYKSVSPTSVQAGDSVTYTITLFNESADLVTLRLTDTLPVSFTYQSLVGSTPTPILTTPLVWELNLAPSATLTLTFTAETDWRLPTGTFYNHVAGKVGTILLPTSGDKAPVHVIGLPRYDLQVEKDNGVSFVEAGDDLTYTIRYTCTADPGLSLENVVLTETLAPASYLIYRGGDPNWQSLGNGAFTYALGDLGPGATGEVLFSVHLSESLPADILRITNTVRIAGTPNQPAVDDISGNNIAVDLDPLPGPDLVIVGMSHEPTKLDVAQPLTFHVVVHNQGMLDTGTWFFVELYAKHENFAPAGPPVDVFDHRGGYCADADCSQIRDNFIRSVGDLGVGESITVTFPITLTTTGVYTFYAQVDVSWHAGPPWGFSYGVIPEMYEENNLYTYGAFPVGVAGYQVYLPVVLKNFYEE